MSNRVNRIEEEKSKSTTTSSSQKNNNQSSFQFTNNLPKAIQMQKLQETADNSSKVKQLKATQEMTSNAPQTQRLLQAQERTQKHTIQKKSNNTGLPDTLKSNIENLSGYTMDDVKVHYNSDKPTQLKAHAYAQGTDIHLGSGQEKHLAHEAWHVVQQKQGRVQPTTQMKSKVNVNDDAGLEKEADIMGEKALQMQTTNTSSNLKMKSLISSHHSPVQGKFVKSEEDPTPVVEAVGQLQSYLQRTLKKWVPLALAKNILESNVIYYQDEDLEPEGILTKIINDEDARRKKIKEEDLDWNDDSDKDLMGLESKRFTGRSGKLGTHESPIDLTTYQKDKGGEHRKIRFEEAEGIQAIGYRAETRTPKQIKEANGFNAFDPMTGGESKRLVREMYGVTSDITPNGVSRAWISKQPSVPRPRLSSLGFYPDAQGFASQRWVYKVRMPSSMRHVIPTEEMVGGNVKVKGYSSSDSLLIMDNPNLSQARYIALLEKDLDEIHFLTPIPLNWIVGFKFNSTGRKWYPLDEYPQNDTNVSPSDYSEDDLDTDEQLLPDQSEKRVVKNIEKTHIEKGVGGVGIGTLVIKNSDKSEWKIVYMEDDNVVVENSNDAQELWKLSKKDDLWKKKNT
ncbi:eCIS core domain-containing protein [Flavivirga aquatica]|uniref:eCIS core domain-containing protein n=1 Tax=Flavivirga aquatica TaxID=1849968 RepID=UPI0009F4C0A7|nr:DUF4157 domain-containing protein [Flavivirga aquatica]